MYQLKLTTFKKWIPFYLPLFFLTLFFSSCEKDLEDKGLTTNQEGSIQGGILENFANGDNVTVNQGYYHDRLVNYTEVDQYAVIEGDIVVNKSSITKEPRVTVETSSSNKRINGAARAAKRYRWPDNIVYFTINPNLPDQARVNQAIAHWEANTRVRFIQRTNQLIYVSFDPAAADMCGSPVGMGDDLGSGQVNHTSIQIGVNCTLGNVIHEIGHTVGLWHEHTRTDRGNFVTINNQNIVPGTEHNFQRYVDRGKDGFDGGAFDFGSIMMYPSNAFSRNGLPTITRLNGTTFGAQRTALSAGDINTINSLYGTVPAGTKAMLRYVNTSNGDHFYTQWMEELGVKRGNYYFEGVDFYVYPIQASGTVPLYRYVNTSNGDHFYTQVYQSYGGYVYEMVAGYIFNYQAPGTLPIFRYHNSRNGDHFYTPVQANYGGYVYEMIAFYTYPN